MKIAIAGYGMEGQANYQYWRDKGELTIVDERPSLDDLPVEAATILGEGVFSKLDGFDLVIRTAGLAPRKIKTNGKVWSATNEFFAKCPAPIVGVTGTKGKGTTSSLVASILEAAGKTVHLVGNIGQPALEVLDVVQPDDIVVYELSSFQLWDLDRSPQVAVVLPIEPDHLDVHVDFHDYLEAKTNIVRHQTAEDTVIYHEKNQWSSEIGQQSPAGEAVRYPFAIGEFAEHLQIPGKHNLENASAAIAAARQYIDDDAAIVRGLEGFTGLPHRLKLVAEKRGVRYYDDSIGTTPGSSIAAISSFSEPKILILGGSSKGATYESIIKACKASQCKVIAIGETGRDVVEVCRKLGVDVEYVDGLMDAVVNRADEMAHSGDVVILSPASASFDQYKNYIDRGEQFIAAVNRLAD